ncbi:MAG TPA: hypothetical protein VGD81_11945, partial [Opitutaceae bacterium]
MTLFPYTPEPGWCITDHAFDACAVERNGSKFMIGNGAIGMRGTLEEFGREQRVACTLSGLYDQVPGCWREPVNAPNGFLARVWCDGRLLSPLELAPCSHRQALDLRTAVHRRETCYVLADGNEVRIEAGRFLSLVEVDTGVAWLRVSASRDCRLVIETGIDGEVWDLNGPHLGRWSSRSDEDLLELSAATREKGVPVAVAAALAGDFGRALVQSEPVVAPA